MSDDAAIQQELTFYRKKVDELSGENLKLDYTISGLKHELKQRRDGFSLLSSLQQSVGLQQEVSAIFSMVIDAINSTLGMDKTIVLFPSGEAGIFKPALVLGVGLDEAELLKLRIEVPTEISSGKETVLVTKKSEINPFCKTIQDHFALPYFLMCSVMSAGQNLAIFISGRMREAKPFYPPLDSGDIDTFLAIGGLISSTIEVMKVVALKETDRLKTEFFANLSHEFRTPITLTIGPLEEIITGRYGEVSDKIKSEAQIMLRSQRRLLDLITQILDLAKLESGAMNLKVQPVKDLNSFLVSRFEQFQSLAQTRGIELKKEIDPLVVGKSIYLDLEKFDKVIFNLLSNSLKFTKSGSVSLQTQVGTEAIDIFVRDTGIGIRPDQLPFIFDRFKQADGSSSRDYAGTGIGLSLVKEIVELHGATIEVLSEYGKGSVFHIKLRTGFAHLPPNAIHNEFSEQERVLMGSTAPTVIEETLTEQQELEATEAANQETLSKLKPNQPKVLYVDDNGDLRRFVRNLLKDEYNVLLAVNGLDGLEKAKLHKVDIVLSDLMMPVMIGTELLQRIKSEPELEGVPFVMLTSRGDMDTKIEQLENGADDFLSKPFSETEIRARITNLLKIRQQQRQNRLDLQAAKLIQRSLLPGYEHQLGDCRIEVLYHPAEALSGDFFEVTPIGDSVYFAIADVTSHGTAAAQVTYLVKGILRNVFTTENLEMDIGKLMARIAKEYRAYGIDYAVAMAVGRLNRLTGNCDYVSTSFPDVFIEDAETRAHFQPSRNPYMDGSPVEVDREYTGGCFELKPGSRFYLFSDGCFEFYSTRKKRDFGQRALEKLLPNLGATTWRKELFDKLALENGKEHFDDDITVMRVDRAPAKS